MSMHPERNLFSEFRNRVFVETGSYRGDGIKLAIDAGFKRIISIDNNITYTEFCKSRFTMPWLVDAGIKIELHTGDSVEILGRVIGDIQERITFWLDAHWLLLEGTEEGPNPWPLKDELQQIGKHHIKDHTILIDDMLHLTHALTTGWHRKDIEQLIEQINPRYNIKYFPNPVMYNILAAWI